MIKRVAIAGSRDYTDYAQAKAYIDFCLSRIGQQYTIVIVSGGCRGADMLGERYARENGLSVERYPAQWEAYGKSAGPVRNREMARLADYVICFWDGKSRGTQSMIRYARQLGKPVMVKAIHSADGLFHG